MVIQTIEEFVNIYFNKHAIVERLIYIYDVKIFQRDNNFGRVFIMFYLETTKSVFGGSKTF